MRVNAKVIEQILAGALMLWPVHAVSNDSAAGVAANGIYLMEEKNVSIEREDLCLIPADAAGNSVIGDTKLCGAICRAGQLFAGYGTIRDPRTLKK
jgi:hypothetical protein